MKLKILNNLYKDYLIIVQIIKKFLKNGNFYKFL